MINHKEKYIEAGHGDLCVGNIYNALTIQNIRPPQVPGSTVMRDDPDIQFLGERVDLEFNTMEELTEFQRKLEAVESGNIGFVEYKGWHIRFISSDSPSIKVFRIHFDFIWNRMLQCVAC